MADKGRLGCANLSRLHPGRSRQRCFLQHLDQPLDDIGHTTLPLDPIREPQLFGHSFRALDDQPRLRSLLQRAEPLHQQARTRRCGSPCP